MKQKPIQCPGGRVRIVVDATKFKASTTIAAALVEVDPGGMRELHWHPSADEWQYYISGQARMTVFGAQGTANTFDYQAGDVGYVPYPMGHYIENTGNTTLRFLEVFRSDRFLSVSLEQWMALTPPEVVQQTAASIAGSPPPSTSASRSSCATESATAGPALRRELDARGGRRSCRAMTSAAAGPNARTPASRRVAVAVSRRSVGLSRSSASVRRSRR